MRASIDKKVLDYFGIDLNNRQVIKPNIDILACVHLYDESFLNFLTV